MTTAISGTTAEQRRDEAVRQVLRLRPLTEIRQEFRLSAADLEIVARRVRSAYPWIAAIVFGPREDDDVGLCPGSRRIPPFSGQATPSCSGVPNHRAGGEFLRTRAPAG